jgi:hypothetical protein
MSGAVFSFYSSFNSGIEGWTIATFGYPYIGGTGPVQIVSGGVGNTGYLQTEDAGNGYLFFIAPPSWSGDLTGATMSFFLKSFNPDNYSLGTQPQPVLWITDGTHNLFALRSGTLPGISGTGWTPNQIVLDPSLPLWSLNPSSPVSPSPALVSSVLSNVTQIGILADWVVRFAGHPLGCTNPSGNCTDITGLDEVRLYSASVVIPEPGTAMMLVAGFAGILLLATRCQAR